MKQDRIMLLSAIALSLHPIGPLTACRPPSAQHAGAAGPLPAGHGAQLVPGPPDEARVCGVRRVSSGMYCVNTLAALDSRQQHGFVFVHAYL
jgi:hypothetical protein